MSLHSTNNHLLTTYHKPVLLEIETIDSEPLRKEWKDLGARDLPKHYLDNYVLAERTGSHTWQPKIHNSLSYHIYGYHVKAVHNFTDNLHMFNLQDATIYKIINKLPIPVKFISCRYSSISCSETQQYFEGMYSDRDLANTTIISSFTIEGNEYNLPENFMNSTEIYSFLYNIMKNKHSELLI